MDDKLKAAISKIVDEAVSSRLSNQQATLTFNLENIDAEDRLKKMLNVDKYDMALWESFKLLAIFSHYHCEYPPKAPLNFIRQLTPISSVSNNFHQLREAIAECFNHVKCGLRVVMVGCVNNNYHQ